MRVLIAGATGAIGRELIPALVEAGHEVTGTSRSVERAGDLVELGATPAVLDALDPVATAATVARAKPDVIVHQLTALPKVPNPRKSDIYEATDRLRREGTANLVAAAVDAGVKRIVAQSIAFAYAPEGDAIDGIVLRYGWFYGPGTYFAPEGFIAGEVRKRRYPLIGSAKGITSFVHTQDAAGATVAAIERGAPGIFNIVDDEPLALRDWLPLYAEALGAKPPRRIPRLVARLAAGPVVTLMATEMRGATNAKAKRGLGWSPRYASVRDGFAELSA